MSTETSGELKLIKPEISDNIDQTINNDLPNNFEKIDTEITNRVKKVAGKGLSTNDYTTEDKNKLDEVFADATKVEVSAKNGNILINNTETKVYDDTDVLLELSNLAKESTMPHEVKDLKGNRTYKFGLQLSIDGNPQIIFEEVI